MGECPESRAISVGGRGVGGGCTDDGRTGVRERVRSREARPVETLEIENNDRMLRLCGVCDRNLPALERAFGVTIARRGNRIDVFGKRAADALNALCAIEAQPSLDPHALAQVIDEADGGILHDMPEEPVFRTPKMDVRPRSRNQVVYMRTLLENPLVFALGPAGAGKTYLAVAAAVAQLRAGEVDRLVLSRPAVEAGERLGFLPGDMREKVDPYLKPLFDALHDFLPAARLRRALEDRHIEIAPLAFMRGRTLANAFLLLDEAQNCTDRQMRMFLTRQGPGSKAVVTGDLSQTDLPGREISGLAQAREALRGKTEACFVELTGCDSQRHRLVRQVIEAYARFDSQPGRLK